MLKDKILLVLAIPFFFVSIAFLLLYFYNYLEIPTDNVDAANIDYEVKELEQEDLFSVNLVAKDITKPVNLVNLKLGFNNSDVQVTELDFIDSDFTIVLESNIDNTNGVIKLLIVEPNPGVFSKYPLNLVSINYKKLKDVDLNIQILEETRIFTNTKNGQEYPVEYTNINIKDY